MRQKLILAARFTGSITTAFLCLAIQAFSQDATVTFYSHGSMLTSGLPGGKDIFIGSIFDGQQDLVSLHDTIFPHNNRFISLRFQPGQHTFGGSYGKHPKPRETLSMELKAGQKYFIWATGETQGVPGVFTVSHARLELVDCSDAQADLAKATVLRDKALWKYTRARRAAMVVDEASPPSCQ